MSCAFRVGLWPGPLPLGDQLVKPMDPGSVRARPRSWQAYPVGIDRTDWLEADRLNEQGRVRADAGDWDAALSLYRQAVSGVPAFEPAWFNMALVYKRRRQWAEAMDCNERAAALGGAEGRSCVVEPGRSGAGMPRGMPGGGSASRSPTVRESCRWTWALHLSGSTRTGGPRWSGASASTRPSTAIRLPSDNPRIRSRLPNSVGNPEPKVDLSATGHSDRTWPPCASKSLTSAND